MKKIALILVVLLLVAGAYLLPNLKPEAKNETTGNTAVEPAPVSDQTGPGVPQEPGETPDGETAEPSPVESAEDPVVTDPAPEEPGQENETSPVDPAEDPSDVMIGEELVIVLDEDQATAGF
jgi:hypothetical protein